MALCSPARNYGSVGDGGSTLPSLGLHPSHTILQVERATIFVGAAPYSCCSRRAASWPSYDARSTEKCGWLLVATAGPSEAASGPHAVSQILPPHPADLALRRPGRARDRLPQAAGCFIASPALSIVLCDPFQPPGVECQANQRAPYHPLLCSVLVQAPEWRRCCVSMLAMDRIDPEQASETRARRPVKDHCRTDHATTCLFSSPRPIPSPSLPAVRQMQDPGSPLHPVSRSHHRAEPHPGTGRTPGGPSRARQRCPVLFLVLELDGQVLPRHASRPYPMSRAIRYEVCGDALRPSARAGFASGARACCGWTAVASQSLDMLSGKRHTAADVQPGVLHSHSPPFLSPTGGSLHIAAILYMRTDITPCRPTGHRRRVARLPSPLFALALRWRSTVVRQGAGNDLDPVCLHDPLAVHQLQRHVPDEERPNLVAEPVGIQAALCPRAAPLALVYVACPWPLC